MLKMLRLILNLDPFPHVQIVLAGCLMETVPAVTPVMRGSPGGGGGTTAETVAM